MKFDVRKTIWDDLNKYDINASDDSFVEVTQWTNGEGIDVTIDNKHLSLTYGELDAIVFLVKNLDYGDCFKTES